MRSQFEYAIKDEGTALEENVTPVPSVIFYYIVGFCFDPEVEAYQRYASNPSARLCMSLEKILVLEMKRTDLMMCVGIDNPSGTRKHEKANIQ